MDTGSGKQVLQIKKYPNRRYYDATRSCHVTLDELHDLVRGGHDICITDSRSGDDITNLVLVQIMLEKDHLKLDLFPATMLHWILRSNRQALRSTMEPFIAPFMKIMAASQKQFDAYVRQAAASPVTAPLDWLNRMMESFSSSDASDKRADAASQAAEGPMERPPDEAESIDDLRRQISDLSRRIEDLSGQERSGPV